MSEKMYPIPFKSLMNWIVTEYAREGEIFGLYATTGRAVSFLAPGLFALFVSLSGDTRLGILGIVLILLAGLLLMLPVSWREAFLSACLGCKNALMSYLSGVLKTSLFVFVATLTGLFLLGINDALLLSVFMGILEVFPYIGPILASVPILLTALGQGFGQAVLALIVVIAVQQIEGNFVTPYFTASSTSIKPLSAFIGVFVLGSLMGLWGVVLAIPLIVTVRSVLWSIRSAVIMMKPS